MSHHGKHHHSQDCDCENKCEDGGCDCEKDCNSKAHCHCSCQNGGGCGCKGGHFQRRYKTKAEQVAELEAYLNELKLEVQAVEERLVDLRK